MGAYSSASHHANRLALANCIAQHLLLHEYYCSVAGCISVVQRLRRRPLPPQVLYALLTRWCEHRSAAAVMVAYARRLRLEGASDHASLAKVSRAYAAAVNSLSLADPAAAWLDAAGGLAGPLPALAPPSGLPLLLPASPADGTAAPAGAPAAAADGDAVLTLRELRREVALFTAAVVATQRMPGLDPRPAQQRPDDLFQQLLGLGLYDGALALAAACLEGAALAGALERAFAAMAAQCVRLQLRDKGALRF